MTPAPKPIINVQNLSKKYGNKVALQEVNFSIHPGEIVGLLGPNGAGKTTLLKALLGMTAFEGNLSVFGLNPFKNRIQMMEQTCFIADVAILPKWLKVSQALKFVENVHPKFSKAQALHLLSKTDIQLTDSIKNLSKGMIVQLHLALIMAIDVNLLILDEPTLGLDIVYRKIFYRNLLNDFFNEQRSIIIATHQIEEIGTLLTDLMIVNKGKLILKDKIENLTQRYVTLTLTHPMDKSKVLEKFHPIDEQTQLGETRFILENLQDTDIIELKQLGTVYPTPLSDLFLAKISGAYQ